MQVYYFVLSEEEEEQEEALEDKQSERVLECTYRYRRGQRAIAAQLQNEATGDTSNIVEVGAYKDSNGYYCSSKGYVRRIFSTYEEALYFLKDWAYQ